jgi:uncharacterized protein YqjF (DUF2071 family)
MASSTFLTAEWRKLAMANYAVDGKLLEPFLPAGTELDVWNGTCYVSLVGFMFLNTRLKSVPIPFHTNFEEVNLRFYVRYREAGLWKRGVVFIKEIVPRPALSIVANRIYKENYETMRMDHKWLLAGDTLVVTYRWRKAAWNSFVIKAEPGPVAIAEGSEEEFITDHYWGYTRISASLTSQYEVQHPRWDVYPVSSYDINVDFGNVYGDRFAYLGSQTPKSVMLAEGSKIAVKAGASIVYDPSPDR